MCSNNSVRLLLLIASHSPCIFSISLSIVTLCIHFLNGALVWKMREDTAGLFRAIYFVPFCLPLVLFLWVKRDTENTPKTFDMTQWYRTTFILALKNTEACCDSRKELNSISINAGLVSTEDQHPGWMTVRAAVWQDEVCSFPYLLTHLLFSECLKLITASRNQTEGWKSALSLQWSHSSS